MTLPLIPDASIFSKHDLPAPRLADLKAPYRYFPHQLFLSLAFLKFIIFGIFPFSLAPDFDWHFYFRAGWSHMP